MSEDPTALSALALAQQLESGDLRPSRVVAVHLDRIAERDPAIGAWEHIAADAASAVADRLDCSAPAGLLHGIPLGVKDIIDTAGLPTAYGSPIYRDHVPSIDAAAVALVRAAGGIVLGKTVTAEFAHRHPGRTVNPHDPDRTPGGSSSGSAAAVADHMVPLALGTQTTASTIRPASYCGVIGYRPTYGLVGMAGVKPCAPSLDTLGLFARSVGDCALLRDCLLERPFTPPPTWLGRALRIGFCRTPFWHLVEAPAMLALEAAVARLDRAGAVVRERALPANLDGVAAHHRAVSTFELSRNLATERLSAYEQLSRTLREGKLRDGAAMDLGDYVAAMDALDRCRLGFADWLEDDVLVAPSASGIAPLGRGSTGPFEFSALWTALHLPAMSVPLPGGVDGLPLGLQIVARRGKDLELFAAAAWIVEALR